ncbi:hypothetical protein [Roseomonas marmotae]|uniref:Uncharacterized protein n=1 Tax=Roseomonas marmotae TaxID=2768161 RepID=A0ABS3KD29_9PROT|nr:hypothetical protein [Roseomonas marmotae]MBO1075369.1 hypothetical protein [Roseomonas marmotae]QTI78359.1 hypothetical protein IAI58_11725 [Roseomonas marmotae]
MQRAELRAGLRGALMLARGRAEGIMLMPLSAAGAGRSFWAAVFCLPIFLLLRVVLSDVPLSSRGLLAELCGFTVGWAGYALASLPMALAAGRGALWPRFLAAWNWASFVQYGVILLLALLAGLGLPGWLVQGMELAGLGYALWLQWFATALALQISGARAAGFVLLDLVLGMVMSGFVSDIAGR